jgi:hypothetical protein
MGEAGIPVTFWGIPGRPDLSPPMTTIADEITAHLQPLVGLKLSIARRAADLRGFHFGRIRRIERGTSGEYVLHIQCPWRIEGPEGIVTGRLDLWEPAQDSPDIDWETWDYEENENLQDRRISELLKGYDPDTRSFVNATGWFVVETVQGDMYGGAVITLSGGFRLVLFPAGSESEDWRIFRPKTDEPHFVITGGKIEDQKSAD